MAGYLGLGGGGGSQKQIIYSGLHVSSSRVNMPVPIFWGQRRLSTNAIWYNDFQKHKQSAKGKGGGGKGGGMYTYTAATITALGEGPLDSGGILNVWTSGSSTTTTTLSKLNMTLFLGTAVQAPWSFVTTKYPTQARSYALTAYLACPKENLGSSAQIPDNGYEASRTLSFAHTLTSNGYENPHTGVITSAVDVLLSDCLNDWLTSSQYGMGFSSGDLSGPVGDQSQWVAYMRAQGLFFSPYLHSQEKATSVIDRWAQLTNSWIYWAGTQFVYVPLGDSVVTGNGVTYTPDLTVCYDLGPADFIDKGTPVKVNRADPADCYNRTTLSFVDRTVGYTTNSVEYKDQTLVDQYGLRDASTVNGDEVCNSAVAQNIVELLGKRAAYLRNTYQFKLNYRFIRLLPGSIVTLTEPNIGLSRVRVRVKTVAEDDNDSLDILAEELPGLIGTVSAAPATGPNPLPTPNNPDQNVDPGNVNTPAIVEPNSNFTGGQAVVVIAASGGANWGGCHVHVSFDGVNYSQIGTISSPAPQGLLTSTLASHADPDTTNTLAVDCTESQTVPASGITQADADANRTLSLVCTQPTLVGGTYVFAAGELLSFGTVTTTGTYSANLMYLRRGQYGSAPASHAIGDQFTVVDVLGTSGTSVRYNLPAQYIGQTIYIKLTSFNPFSEGAEQDISVVDEYQYTPTGAGYGTGTAGKPSTPATPAASPGSGQIIVNWSANPPTDNVTGYQLWAASGTGSPFSSAVKIWSGLSTSYVHTGIATGASFTYFIVAVNSQGSSPNSSGVSATVTSSPSGSIIIKNSGTIIDSSTTSVDFSGSGVSSVSTDGSGHVAVVVTGGGGGGGGGLLYSNAVAAGIPASTTTETTLMSYSMPGGTLANVGDAIEITACLEMTNSGGGTKVMRVYFGALSTGLQIGSNGHLLIVRWRVVKTGSNTQKVFVSPMVFDSTIGSIAAINSSNSFGGALLGTETDTSTIVIKTTGTTGTAGLNAVVSHYLSVQKIV